MIPSYFSHFAWDSPSAQRCIWYCSQCKLYLFLFVFLSEQNFDFAIDFGLQYLLCLWVWLLVSRVTWARALVECQMSCHSRISALQSHDYSCRFGTYHQDNEQIRACCFRFLAVGYHTTVGIIALKASRKTYDWLFHIAWQGPRCLKTDKSHNEKKHPRAAKLGACLGHLMHWVTGSEFMALTELILLCSWCFIISLSSQWLCAIFRWSVIIFYIFSIYADEINNCLVGLSFSAFLFQVSFCL